MAMSMSAGLGRDCRSSFTSGVGGEGDSQTGPGRARDCGGVRSGRPAGRGGKCEISRRPAPGPRAGGGGGGPGGRPLGGGGLGGGRRAGGAAEGGIGASGAEGGTFGACSIEGGGGAPLDVGPVRPARDARSSVAARLSSSALIARPASVAASTARFSHTMASYRSPCFQSAAPVVSPHATSSASLASGEGNAGNMTFTRYRREPRFSRALSKCFSRRKRVAFAGTRSRAKIRQS